MQVDLRNFKGAYVLQVKESLMRMKIIRKSLRNLMIKIMEYYLVLHHLDP